MFTFTQKNPSEFLVEQRVKSNEKWAQSNEQRVKSNEQRAESNEQRAKSNEQRAKSNEQRAESNEQQTKSNEQRAKVTCSEQRAAIFTSKNHYTTSRKCRNSKPCWHRIRTP